MTTLGLEEEVFVLEPLLPTTRSLYYLSRLFWQNPKRNYILTASNFARGQDLKCGMMSGVEVATDICQTPQETIEQLRFLRKQLAAVAEGYIAALGHRLQTDTPTNVCALQIHLGGDGRPDPKLRQYCTFSSPINPALSQFADAKEGEIWPVVSFAGGIRYRTFNRGPTLPLSRFDHQQTIGNDRGPSV